MSKSASLGAEEEDERRGGPKASFHKELAFFDKIRQKYVHFWSPVDALLWQANLVFVPRFVSECLNSLQCDYLVSSPT